MARVTGEGYGYGLQYAKNQTIISSGTKSTSDLTGQERLTVQDKFKEANESSVKYAQGVSFSQTANKKIEVFTKILNTANEVITYLSVGANRGAGVAAAVAGIVAGTNRYLTTMGDVYQLVGASDLTIDGINYSSGLAVALPYNNNGFANGTKTFAALASNDEPGALAYLDQMDSIKSAIEKAIADIKGRVTENTAFKQALSVENDKAQNAAENIDAIYKDINGDKLAYEMQRAQHLSAILSEMRMAASERLRNLTRRVFAQGAA
jgi:hypothetical protein